MFEETFRGCATSSSRARATSSATARPSTSRAGCSASARAVIAPCPDELAWIAKLAERFDVALSPHASLVFDEVSSDCYGGIAFGAGRRAARRCRRARRRADRANPETDTGSPGGLASHYKPLFSGPAVERTPELRSSGRRGEIRSRARTRARGRSATAGHRSSNGTSRRAARAHRARPPRPARCARRRRRGSTRVEVPSDGEPWWISPKAFIVSTS
jgi:hypothetical protein